MYLSTESYFQPSFSVIDWWTQPCFLHALNTLFSNFWCSEFLHSCFIILSVLSRRYCRWPNGIRSRRWKFTEDECYFLEELSSLFYSQELLHFILAWKTICEWILTALDFYFLFFKYIIFSLFLTTLFLALSLLCYKKLLAGTGDDYCLQIAPKNAM